MPRTPGLFGYARSPANDPESLARQREALLDAGCTRCTTEEAVALREVPPKLAALLASLRSGQILVVASFEALGMPPVQLCALLAQLTGRSIGFLCLDPLIDTRTDAGQACMAALVAVHACRLRLTAERRRAGIAAARKRGMPVGRPPIDPKTIRAARALMQRGELTAAQIGEKLGIDRSTVFKYAQATDTQIEAVAQSLKRRSAYGRRRTRSTGSPRKRRA